MVHNYYKKQCIFTRTSVNTGGTTLVRLCLARIFFLVVRDCALARLQLQQPIRRRQIAPNLLSGGQHAVADSAGATLDFLVQHFISRNRAHLFG